MNSLIIFYLTYVSMFLLITIIGFILPKYFRKDLLFGIRIPDNNSFELNPEVIRNQYKNSFTVITIVLFLFYVVLLYLYPDETVGTILIFVQVFYLYSLLVYFNRKVLKLKFRADTDHTEVADEIYIDTEKRQITNKLTVKTLFPSVILVIIHFIITYLRYKKLQETIPKTFDLLGNVISTDSKSWELVYQFPTISLFILIVFTIVFLAVNISKQVLNPQDIQVSKMQSAIFRKRWNAFFTYLAPMMIIYNILISLHYLQMMHYHKVLYVLITLGIPVIIVIITLFIAMQTGQSGSKISLRETGRRGNRPTYDDDKYWKLGIVYFNPNDPTIFIEKRMRIGWTINMANPIAVSGFLLLIVLTILLIIYFR